MTKRFLVTIGIMGALSIIFGAFGTHILEGNISDNYLKTYNTANEYLMFHTLALLGLAFMNRYVSRSYLNTIYYFFLVGIILFSGSLYLISIKDITGFSMGSLGIITPVGGLFLLSGWITLIFAGASYKHTKGNK
jgi:uncharacterized membrane protein YgdD (TMEM256/DUF423 family)